MLFDDFISTLLREELPISKSLIPNSLPCHFQNLIKVEVWRRRGVGESQERERGEAFGIEVGQSSCDTGTPIMTREH